MSETSKPKRSSAPAKKTARRSSLKNLLRLWVAAAVGTLVVVGVGGPLLVGTLVAWNIAHCQTQQDIALCREQGVVLLLWISGVFTLLTPLLTAIVGYCFGVQQARKHEAIAESRLVREVETLQKTHREQLMKRLNIDPARNGECESGKRSKSKKSMSERSKGKKTSG
jgi:hypothetical protein